MEIVMLTLAEADALLAALGVDEGGALVLPALAPPPPAGRGAAAGAVVSVSASSAQQLLPLQQTQPSQDAVALTPMKKKKSATPTRDRERAELRELREQVLQLSARLDALSTANLGGRPRLTGRAAIMRHIARSSHARLLQAKRENRTLRHRLAGCLEVQSVFQTRLQALQRAKRALHWSHQPRKSALDAIDKVALEHMVAQLDAAFAQVNDVLPARPARALDLAGHEYYFKYAPTRRALVGGSSARASPLSTPFALEDERVLPFAFGLVVDAAWRAWVRWHMEGVCRLGGCWSDPSAHADVHEPERTFAVKAWLRSSLSASPHEPTFVKVKIAVRKYSATRPDRLVLVWKGTTEGEREFDGLYTEETAWVTVERGATSSSSGGEYTALRSCVRMTPRCSGGSFSADDVEAFTKIVFQSYKDDLSMIYEEMESLLLLHGSKSKRSL